MKKAKIFVIALGLMTVTAGVFAGKAKFTNSGLYWVRGSVEEPIASGTLPGEMTTTQVSSATQPTLLNQSGLSYSLETFTGTGYIPVYAAF